MATKPRRTRRPNEPRPPRVMSAEEIAAAAPHDLEAGDRRPRGVGRPAVRRRRPGPRAAARAGGKRQESSSFASCRRTRRRWARCGMRTTRPHPKISGMQALWQRIQNKACGKDATEATSPEDQAQIDAAHEALRAAERARKAREKMAALRERLRNPPAPDAPELIGAIFDATGAVRGDLSTSSATTGIGNYTATHLLTVGGTWRACRLSPLLRELDSVEITGMGIQQPVGPGASHRSSRSTGYATSCCSCGSGGMAHGGRRGRYRPGYLRRPCTRDRGGGMGPRADARKLTRLPGALW